MKYKVTKVYVVEAANKAEAVDAVAKDPDTLEFVSIKPVEISSWKDSIKKQLTG